MNSLLNRELMGGKVQMVYLDPPYGVKFSSNFQPRVDQRDVKDGDDYLTREPDTIKAYRDTWTLGVHSYLTYLRDRLRLCRELLADSGSIFVQISDENVHLVRNLMDEVFGRENAMPQIVFRKTTGAGSPSGYVESLPQTFDYLVWYAKDRTQAKPHRLFLPRSVADDQTLRWVETSDGGRRRMTAEEVMSAQALPPGVRPFRPNPLTSQTGGATTSFAVEFQGVSYRPGKGGWKTNRAGMNHLLAAERLMAIGNTLCFVRYLDDFPYRPVIDIWDDTRGGGYVEDKIYVVQTNSKVVARCVLMTTSPGDLVFDSTCGSGTTAYVAEQWGRRWITCDTSRVALALARQRMLTATFPYYRLADPGKGVSGRFVYKKVPHIQLKDYAQNTRVDPITERYAPEIAAAGEDRDQARLRDTKRLQREEIDRVVAEDAEPETLYDQPYIDSGVVRVSGPFTVEAIPPAALEVQEESTIGGAPESVTSGERGDPRVEAVDVVNHITNLIADLARHGVTFPDNRVLRLQSLTARPGGVLHAEGHAADEADLDRVAVSFGPQHGSVSLRQVEDALYEARRGGFDAVIFCGFAFQAEAQAFVSEHRDPHLRAFVAHIKPDALLVDQRGESLLKTTSGSQLFAVFGEPDVELRGNADETLQVTLNGVDVYDPLTGQVHSARAWQVAAWFVDTDYDGRTFCVCQAFFPNRSAWGKLKRALRGRLDEERLEALSGTVSLPFTPGSHRRVAVKVIDQRGDEVMRVLPLAPTGYSDGQG